MNGYDQVFFNTPFVIKTGKDSLHLCCCDCGLIHQVGVRVINNRAVELSFKEDKRRTAQFRRHHGIEGSSTVVFGRKHK